MKRLLWIFLLILAMAHSGTVCAQLLGWNTNTPIPDNLMSAIKLYDRAQIIQGQGNYPAALNCAQQAWELVKDMNDSASLPYRTMIASALGSFYASLSDYEKAEHYHLLAIEIAKSEGDGPLRNDAATLINNLGLLYEQIGDYDNAGKCYKQACEMIQQARKENNQYGVWQVLVDLQYAKLNALYLGNLGSFYYKTGDFKSAKKYFYDSKMEYEQLYQLTLDANTTELYALSLHNYGMALFRNGEIEEAQKSCQEAHTYFRMAHPMEHISWAGNLKGLGEIFYQKGDYPKALEYYERAFRIIDANVSKSHPDYISIQNHLGEWYLNQQRYKEARPYLLDAFSSTKNRYAQTVDYMSERLRSLYWQKIHAETEQLYPDFAYRAYQTDRNAAQFAYDNELFKKGLLLSSSNAVKQSVLESRDTKLLEQWNELVTKKQQIQALVDRQPNSPYLSQLRDEAEQLEKTITRKSAVYRENMRQWSITWDSVRAALKPHQVAIEFMSAPLNEDSTMYCALLLRHDSQQPELIPLFEEKEVAALLLTDNAATINRTYAVGGNGLKLQKHIWSHIQPYLQAGDEVFFSPTGLLHRIAMENIPYDARRTMGEVYHLVRLSSTRELAMKHTASSHQKAALYGGIYYDVDTTELAAQSRRYPQLAQRSITWDTKNRGRASYLKETKEEIEQIQTTLADRPIKVQVFTATAANEESFKALSGTKQNILHLATHGFYWSDSTAQQEQYFHQRSAVNDVQQTSAIDPLERCGLLFAGANTALSGHSDRLPTGVHDGILTAKEISLLDLRGADIVVLSACETGLGDISGEGVFGLQRAFKMAGAQTILMALWRVNDEATRMLMTAFYRHYTAGESKREAFRNAQQEVRNSKHKSPYFWAGFILLD